MPISFEKRDRIVRSGLIFLVLAAALAAGLHTVGDSDMGWHLATGRWIVQHRQIPGSDVLSFTSAGTPWIYPPFADVLFYLVYNVFGYAGLSWTCALACLAVVAYLVRRGDLASAMMALLAIGAIATRTGARPDLFSTVFFALFLGELWAWRRSLHSRLWLLPLITLFWVNFHPGFVAGIAAIAAYLLLEAADLPFAGRRQEARSRLRRACPWLLLTVVATLVNPWGPKIYFASLGLLGAGATRGKLNGNVAVAELRGVPISTHLLYQLIDVRHAEFGFTWLLALAVIFILLAVWKGEFGTGLLVLVALYAVLIHARYIALFAITVATLSPMLFEVIFTGPESRPRSTPASRLPAPAVLSSLMALVFCLLAIVQIVGFVSNRTYIVFNPDLRFGTGLASWFPARASAFIRRELLPGNIFEDYELGGYAAWSLGPEYPDFIDGRGNNPDLGAEQFNLYSADPDSPPWQTEADRWNLNVLLVATANLRGMQNIDPLKFCQSTAWRPVYMDDVSLVFLRNTPANSPWINRLQIDCSRQPLAPPPSASRPALHDFYLNAGELCFILHRDSAAVEFLRQADVLYPNDPNVHLLKGLLLEQQQRYADAAEEYRASLAINENSGVWYSLGRIYGLEGRNEAALQALERAAGLSLQPFNTYMTIAKLQIALNQPEPALASFAKAEKSSPYRGAETLAPEVYAELAEGQSEAYRLLGRWSDAIRWQQEAIQRTPSVQRRWERLARLYEANGQLREAAETRQRMLQSQPSPVPGMLK